MKSDHLAEYVIRPTLRLMEGFWEGINSEAAVNLMLGTAAQESLCGKYLKQVNGPALGIYQVEPATHRDVWDSYLAYRTEQASFMRSLATQMWALEENLIWNLQYATAVARLVYWRESFEWPSDPKDVEALARIWKSSYNTELGRGTEEEFMANYFRYVARD